MIETPHFQLLVFPFKTITNHIETTSKMNRFNGGSTRYLARYVFSHGSPTATTCLKNQFSTTLARSPRTFTPKIPSSPCSHLSHRSYSSSSSSRSGNGFVGWYLGMLESRPILTKSATSALIYTFADLSSQAITQTSSVSFDLIRTLRMAGYGMIVMGPAMHFWFNFVSKILPKRDVINTLKKIFMGQSVFGPIMTAIFFSVNAGLQGENGTEIVARLNRDLLPTLLNGLMYWPICDFITFKFVPVRLQPLASNSFAYLWTIYITYMATLEKADPRVTLVQPSS